MNDRVELFVLRAPAICADMRKTLAAAGIDHNLTNKRESAEKISRYVKQFNQMNVKNAKEMASYYEIIYMIENDMRDLIVNTLEDQFGEFWWINRVPKEIQKEAANNKKRESEAGITYRSLRDIEYITFGQLGEIIKNNWDVFAGILRNSQSLSRVIFQLNLARGTIAHCGVLAEDEVERLQLTLKDWFRVLEGPNS